MHPSNEMTADHKPDQIKVSIWLVCENDQWSALASEFDVIGMGQTQEAAIENLSETLNAYLDSFQAEGATLDDARRPIPMREELRLRLLQSLGKIRAFRHRWVRRSEVDFPMANHLAHC